MFKSRCRTDHEHSTFTRGFKEVLGCADSADKSHEVNLKVRIEFLIGLTAAAARSVSYKNIKAA